jgi:D-tyrosyl-tRNA(Tyr) deacylase
VIGLLQRVTEASVTVDGETIGRIDAGLLVLVCAERGDDTSSAEKLVDRLLAIRVFADDAGKMNLSVVQMGGSVLLVPQFTLAADTRSGTRPGFSRAADPATGRLLFDHVVATARARAVPVATGRFGADMKVRLLNDGPVTLWLRIDPPVAATDA